MRKLLWAVVLSAMVLAYAPNLWAQADHLVINEVQYDATQGGTENAYEWIELYNQTPEDIDLSGWVLCDNMDSVGEAFPAVLVPAGEYVVFCGAVDSFHVNFPSVPAISWPDGSLGNALGNGSDILVLVNSGGQMVDRVNWGAGTWSQPSYVKFGYWDPAVPDVNAGHSIGRSPNGIDTDLVGDWADMATPTPGATNGGAVVYTPHTIYEIQNGGNLADSAVSVTGIVTAENAVEAGGAIADAPGPWHGISVYGTFNANRGDSVEIKGTVLEYGGKTEINISQVTVLGTGTIPSATDVTLNDVKTGSATAESYEGVLVRIPKSLACDTTWMSPTYGEWAVCSGPDTLRIDNSDNTNGVYYAKPAFGVDSVIVTGILNYTYSNFKLMPRDSQDVVNYGPTGVTGGPASAVHDFKLAPCRPNPATRNTRISFSLASGSDTRVTVYNILGQEVRSLSTGFRPTGDYGLTWDLRDSRGTLVPNGVYIVRLDAGTASASRKAIVVR